MIYPWLFCVDQNPVLVILKVFHFVPRSKIIISTGNYRAMNLGKSTLEKRVFINFGGKVVKNTLFNNKIYKQS